MQKIFELGVGRSALSVGRSVEPLWPIALRLVPKTLLMPMRLHALAALVFGNFCFASFLKRAHLESQICEC
jgi:hypothetical protein